MINKLISICIPTYNGSDFLPNTLDSIIPYLNSEIDLIIVDDCSTDSTISIAKEYIKNNHHAKLYQNNINLGMDKNFVQTVKMSKSKYIWFCGQDDLIGKEAIEEVTKTIKENNLIALNCNFSQYNHDYTICKFKSFFDIASFHKYQELKKNRLLIFDSPEEYFSVFTQPPSFLPSVVMERKLFMNGTPEKFNGTHFVQVGILLEAMHNGKIGALTTPLVKGRVPEDSWQTNGRKLISIMTGDLKAKSLAFEKNTLLPQHIIKRDKFKFAINYPFLLANSYKYGLQRKDIDTTQTKNIYLNQPIYLTLINITHSIPPALLMALTDAAKPIKKLLLQLRFIKNIKS
jgi:glycosyltransferase involved in cell wall biosynthesis